MHDRFETFACVIDFMVCHRHKAPVARPGIIQQAHDDRRIPVKMLFVHLAYLQFLVAFARCNNAVDQFRKAVFYRQVIGYQTLGNAIVETFNPALIGGVVMPHHDHWTLVMAQSQEPGFFPHRQADRCKHAGHALIGQPFFGSADKGMHHRLILRFHHAPIAGSRSHALFGWLRQREFVDMGADPSDHLTLP